MLIVIYSMCSGDELAAAARVGFALYVLALDNINVVSGGADPQLRNWKERGAEG